MKLESECIARTVITDGSMVVVVSITHHVRSVKAASESLTQIKKKGVRKEVKQKEVL